MTFWRRFYRVEESGRLRSKLGYRQPAHSFVQPLRTFACNPWRSSASCCHAPDTARRLQRLLRSFACENLVRVALKPERRKATAPENTIVACCADYFHTFPSITAVWNIRIKTRLARLGYGLSASSSGLPSVPRFSARSFMSAKKTGTSMSTYIVEMTMPLTIECHCVRFRNAKSRKWTARGSEPRSARANGDGRRVVEHYSWSFSCSHQAGPA